MTSTFSSTRSRHSPNPAIFTATSAPPPPIPIRHWSQTCHETTLASNDAEHSIQISLAGGAENGQFIYVNESISLLKNKPFVTIIKGSKIDYEEIILEIEHQSIAGCTLIDVELLVERLSMNGRTIVLKTVKSGMFLSFTRRGLGGATRAKNREKIISFDWI